MFSRRLPADLAPNSLGRALAHLREAGTEFIDLTASNPTEVGFPASPEILRALSDAAAAVYRPAPLGLDEGREAVADHLCRQQLDVEPGRVVLTSSSSEAYSYLFKLLCEAGDAVMVPQPSYPLFDYLTRLDGVEPLPYALEYHGRWEVDLASLRQGFTLNPGRIRAVLAVNPNNPTGSFVAGSELRAIGKLCREHDAALIVDEVFGMYPMAGGRRGPSVLDLPMETLTFVLGGLSKAVGLPQLKLGWLVVGGPETLVERALARLELICDTYLSVGTPVQLAAARLLDAGAERTVQIARRIRTNDDVLRHLVASHPSAQLLAGGGGWYAVVQIPAVASEEAVVLDLLEHDRVLVHPGYFFDFPREAFLVVSLLQEPAVFGEGVARLLARTSATGRSIASR